MPRFFPVVTLENLLVSLRLGGGKAAASFPISQFNLTPNATDAFQST
jgi:hypothetical protein